MKRFSIVLLALSMALTACGGSSAPTDNALSSSESSSSSFSIEALQAKAEAGDANAQFELGASYQEGEGTEQNFAEAKKWFEKAAAQNEVRAEFNLGVMYYAGEQGVKKDLKKAREWFLKAAAQENPRALFNLGVMEYRGEDVKQDFEKAHDLFTRSALQGFQEAQFNLGVMHAKGEGREPDVATAYSWFTVAKAYGSVRAQEVIDQVEQNLGPEQIAELKKRAAALKAQIDDNIRKQGGVPPK